MEKLSKKTLSFPRKVFKYGILTVLFSVLVACGNKNDDNGSGGGVVVGGLGNCVNCAGYSPAVIWQGTAQSGLGSVRVDATISADVNGLNISSMTGLRPFFSSTTRIPVSVEGNLIINSGQYFGSCWLPGGTYPISTLSLGSMISGSSYGTPITVNVAGATSASFGFIFVDSNLDNRPDPGSEIGIKICGQTVLMSQVTN